MKRKYHGWIYREQSPGYKDYFRTQYTNTEGSTITQSFGYGRAAEAVAYFEEEFSYSDGHVKVRGLNLGHILLEPTPVGLRVYTEEEPVSTPDKETFTD